VSVTTAPPAAATAAAEVSWRLACAYTLAAAALGTLVVCLGPPGSDLAAHLYQRALYVRDGLSVWNNFWYAGRYSFVTYSFLYYPLAAVLGLKALAVATAAASAGLFAIVVEREWGSCTRWASWLFAAMVAASLLTAAYPYTLGLALALLALAAIQTLRFKLFAAATLATFAASPLAFLLLVVVLAAGLVRTRRFPVRAGLPVVFVGLAGASLWRLFPSGGRFPFGLSQLAAALLFCAIGTALTRRVERARLLLVFFLLYGAACAVCYAIPSDIGANIIRVRFAAIPVAALALSLRRWRPLLPAIGAFALALAWNATPLMASFDRGSEDPSSNAAYWAPAIRFLHAHLTPSFRVEAVDTSGHWEATYLPEAGIPIARGWYRQDDFPKDELLYRPHLGRRAYLAWLRSLGVRYVVLTKAPPDYSSRSETRLLESGKTGFPVVFRTADVTIYSVPSPRPIVTGPDHPRVLALHNSTLTLALHRPGSYDVALSYSPYLSAPGVCVSRRANGMVSLTTDDAGVVRLAATFDFAKALDAVTDVTRACWPNHRGRTPRHS